MRFGRFERRILAAITAVAVMPLLGALLLGQTALREAYAVGVNSRVRELLEQGLSVQRKRLAELRVAAEQTARACARDYELNTAIASESLPGPAAEQALETLLATYPELVSIEVRSGEHVLVGRQRAPAAGAPLRLLTLEQPLEGRPEVTVRTVLGSDPNEEGEYQRAGELTEVFTKLEQSSDYVSGYYLVVYVALLLSVIVLALGVGITLTRRVTRRVAALSIATAKVGAGDLTVSVPDQDPDEVGELTRAFNRMVQDLRQARERIDYLSRISAWQEFARRLAHEIKNPLTPIQLAVQEAHRSYRGEDPRYQRTLEDMRSIVEEEIATLRRLVSEFSEFARLPEVHLSPTDLGVFVRDAMESPFRGDELDEGPPVTISNHISARPIPVQIDAMLLKRCLDNLVQNAVQAIRGSGKPGTIAVVAKAEPRVASLEVRDNGPGVPAEKREQVFDPYYTTKAEGTGLGLAIVKKIVLEHRGDILCTDAPEGGACFRITLPLDAGSKETR